MIEIKDLSKSYAAKAALRGVDLNIGSGEIIGLFGENGAGKTTLMKCILGLLQFKGEILLDGKKIGKDNICRLSFATSEHSFFPSLTAASHRDFYKDHFESFKDQRFSALMDFFGLPMNRPLRSFSTGQKNQFEVILALSQGADYIFMDEPFAGNDIFNREDFYKVLLGILEPNETIMLSTHLIEEVSGFIDRAVLIKHGAIIADRSCSDLEDEGLQLTDWIKSEYGYRQDRVSKALSELTGEEK